MDKLLDNSNTKELHCFSNAYIVCKETAVYFNN